MKLLVTVSMLCATGALASTVPVKEYSGQFVYGVGTATLRAEGHGGLESNIVIVSLRGVTELYREDILSSGALRSVQREQIYNGFVIYNAVATISPGGVATVVVQKRNFKKTYVIKAPPNGNRRDTSNFWFVRDHPKPGATEDAVVFSLYSFSWMKQTNTFLGRKTVSIGHRLCTVNEIKQTYPGGATGTIGVDDLGDMVFVWGSPYRYERVWSTKR